MAKDKDKKAEKKGGLFGRIFGGKKDDAPATLGAAREDAPTIPPTPQNGTATPISDFTPDNITLESSAGELGADTATIPPAPDSSVTPSGVKSETSVATPPCGVDGIV